MKEIHQAYLDNFERIGKEKLFNRGFTFGMMHNENFPELFSMILKRGSDEYILCFSVHHLDWRSGVIVYRSANGQYNWDDRVLPPLTKPLETDTYAFTGTAMLADIERIVNDVCLLT